MASSEDGAPLLPSRDSDSEGSRLREDRTCGRLVFKLSRAERATPATPPPPPREKQRKPAAPPRAARQRPSELERLEAEIAEREEAVADLERSLAKDWADVEALAAHRRARDELQALLARWEELFERTQA